MFKKLGVNGYLIGGCKSSKIFYSPRDVNLDRHFRMNQQRRPSQNLVKNKPRLGFKQMLKNVKPEGLIDVTEGPKGLRDGKEVGQVRFTIF